MKSLFGKYLSSFVIIIVACFVMILVIGQTIMINYASDAKQESAREIADTVNGLIASDETLLSDRERMELLLELVVVGNDSVTVLLADREGNVIALGSNYEPHLNDQTHLPSSFFDELSQGGELTERSAYEDTFGEDGLVLAVPMEGAGGAVVICSPTGSISLLNTMVKTLMMSSLWILLAALIAVYFVSERVNAPLRDIRRAVKDFEAGKFDSRVVVRGKDEIAELGIAFNQMAESIENLDKTRSTFMSNVSHDLRTPMTTIAGFVDAIREGVIPPEKHDHYLGIISAEVHRLSRLVSSLLDVTRIQAGDRKFVKKAFDICEMGRQILISFEQQIEAKQLQIEFVCDEENMTVLADHDAIYQVFYNICDNAVKFSYEGGVFRVSVCREQDNKNKIRVSVYNQGDGIAKEDIPFVFERFYKGDKSRGLDRKGMGLGLYICKTIMVAHKEDIRVSSVQGKDCQFSFTLTEPLLPRD